MQALGGAKNHMVVLPDADIEMAADAAVSAAYGSAGERCMAVSVVVAVGDAADPLVAAINERLPKVKVGPGTDPESEMGPLITREHRDKVASYIDRGREQGAKVVADGRETSPNGDGFFLGVSLLDEVTPEMDAYRDEIFGPVLSVVRAGTYDEAVQMVNDNPYGNGVAIFTRDGGAARQFQFEAQAGMVGHQRADPGAGRVLLVRRLEVVALRRLARVRAGGDQLLHARQGRHVALARSGDQPGRPRVPADALTVELAESASAAEETRQRERLRVAARDGIESTQVGFVPRHEPPQRTKRAPGRGFARNGSLLPVRRGRTISWQWKLGLGEKPHWICPSLEVTRPEPDTVTST